MRTAQLWSNITSHRCESNMAVKKSKVMRDGGKSTKCFCIIGLIVVFLLLMCAVTALEYETLNEAHMGTNLTDNEAINEVEPHGVMLDIFYSITKAIRANYKEVALACVMVLLLILYVYKSVCVSPLVTGRNSYERRIDV